ncbi:integral membrane protein DUF92-domain-containing protein [Cercophora scortea]|uniref:Integral membrane protein DUF92-domain-containing protein n=1 Tax=Cercophora scortea TaxID=314031 RepID=A0AAE0IM11_9PEZI|nr:integral membrane protein DUF92-domain-containing protein [Cercophora scortea]
MKAVIAVPAIALVAYRAYSRSSLTPAGIFAAILTAVAHAVHPWNLPFVLLLVFFFAGTRVTHVKERVKATLTVHSKGSSGGEGPRTHVQVFANSLTASILSLLHAYQLHLRKKALIASPSTSDGLGSLCFSWGGDLLVIGIIANYACVAADTFSSELGILSKGQPRLITSLTLRKVPRGTNGGVSLTGLAAGFLGSMVIVTTSLLFLPLCTDQTAGRLGGGMAWSLEQRRTLIMFLTVWGFLGSVLDSILGGLFQRSVTDVRTGKIVEGEGGVRVLISTDTNPNIIENYLPKEAKAALLSGEGKDAAEKPSRVVENGWDLLDNNDVNFLMAFTMSVGAMAVASWYWGVPLQSAFSLTAS